jgi:hypothetical protein
MELGKSYYKGKELYYGYPCGYRCYFHKDLVKEGLVRVDTENDYEEEYYTIHEARFPIIGCDIIEVDGNLVVIPGKYNLFGFRCDGKIIDIDNSVKVIKSNEKDCVLILTEYDKVKIKWIDKDKGIQWISIILKDGTIEEIASEELLKYL